MDMAEMFFYAESEGLLPTRAGRINAIITDIKNYPAPTIDYTTFQNIVSNNGLSASQLTPSEIRYIESKIR